MATSPFSIDRFGGVDVLTDPEEVGFDNAVSLLNVDNDQPGVLRTRDGYANLTLAAGANAYRSAYFHPGGHILAVRAGGGGAETTEAINNGGAISGTSVAFPLATGGKVRFASIGTPAASTTFIVSSAGSILTWDGSVFATPVFTGTATPPGSFSLIAAWKERLVSVGGATQGRVSFSDAGAPTVFSNSVEPDPGDGETQMAACVYGDVLLVIRQTKMIVFTSVSTSSTGNPIFNYRREVFGNIGSFLSYAVGPGGVYILTTKGLYLTQGGPLSRISEQPRALFGSLLSQSIPSDYDLFPAAALQGRVYFAVPASGSSSLDRTLVYDAATGGWLVWDVAAQSMAVTRYTGSDYLLSFGVPSKHVAQMSPSSTADAGTAIAWNYTSGAYDISGENRVAVTRESSVWGTGTVTLQVANDHGTVDTGSAVALGVSPAVARGWQQIDREGTFWQHKLSGTGPARVNRLVHHVSFVKPAGVE